MVGTTPISVKDKLLKLMAEKQHLEIQINAYGGTLAANNNVGMHGPLVDGEGFPRNDIDIYKVRQARQQIICLQNNHKALMKIIEQLMHQLHAESKQEEPQQLLSQQTAEMHLNCSSTENSDDTDIDMELVKPILLIKHVDAGSPAEQAGLRALDRIFEFGSINAKNFNKELSTVGNVVSHMRNQRISLKVVRGTEILDIILIPHRWSGGGLVGCNIVLAE